MPDSKSPMQRLATPTKGRWMPAFPEVVDFTSPELAERRLRFLWATLGASVQTVAKIEGVRVADVRAELRRLDASATWREPMLDLEGYEILATFFPSIDKERDFDDYPQADSQLERFFGHLRRFVREYLLGLRRADKLDLAKLDEFVVEWDNRR